MARRWFEQRLDSHLPWVLVMPLVYSVLQPGSRNAPWDHLSEGFHYSAVVL
jgi:hypothetical protein